MNRVERQKHLQFLSDINTERVFSNQIDYPITGERKWVIHRGKQWPRCIENGVYPYVVLEDGEIRFSEYPRPKSEIHHPELCNGQDVIGAGMFKVSNGRISCISNESGHYMPDGWSMDFVIKAFEYWDLPLSEEIEIDTRWEIFA